MAIVQHASLDRRPLYGSWGKLDTASLQQTYSSAMNLTPTKATNTSPLASSERSFGTHFPSGSKPIPVPRPQSPTTSRSSHYINGAQRANESQRAPSPQPLNLYRDSSRSLVGPSKSVASSPSSSANSSPRSDSRSRHSRYVSVITHGLK
jgi:hypothetical protein